MFIDPGVSIIGGVASIPNCDKPPQPLAEMQAIFDELTGAVKVMKTGLKLATQQRDYLRHQAEAARKALSAYAAGATPARPDL